MENAWGIFTHHDTRQLSLTLGLH